MGLWGGKVLFTVRAENGGRKVTDLFLNEEIMKTDARRRAVQIEFGVLWVQ